MPELKNQKHEAFAQQLAKGETADAAYRKAGYSANRGNASRLKANDSIRQRIAEIQETQKATAELNNINGRDTETGQFVVGHAGFGGRPKGSRNKLGEQFVADLHHEWQQSGAAALRRVAKDDPVQFVRVVAGILPKELDATLNVNVDLFAECRDFAAAFRLARDYIGADAPLLIEAEAENHNG